MSTTDYSYVVGVFRENSDAARAVDALKQAGIGEDQIQLTEYQTRTSEETESSTLFVPERRTLVQVHAAGREQEAVGIMADNGANNADIPSGTMLFQGSIVSADSETAALQPEESSASSSEGLFDKGFAEKTDLMDDPSIRHV